MSIDLKELEGGDWIKGTRRLTRELTCAETGEGWPEGLFQSQVKLVAVV